MDSFIAIDFETANPKRVSACALGYARVSDNIIVETKGYLIKPVGGHAPFQSKIHRIKEEHTFDKPVFGTLFPEIKDIFKYPLVGHSLFDKQVLNALSDYFNLELDFEYADSSALAKEILPNIKNHKLKTLVKHLKLPPFKSHDAVEDATACANVFLELRDRETKETTPVIGGDVFVFEGLVRGILADDEVDYHEAYALLYWLEDHPEISKQHEYLYLKTRAVLEDDYLDQIEASEMRTLLQQTLVDLEI